MAGFGKTVGASATSSLPDANSVLVLARATGIGLGTLDPEALCPVERASSVYGG